MRTRHTMVVACCLTLVGQAASAMNAPPPSSGLEILDLAGQPVDKAYRLYSANFTASSTSSIVTFVFRHDPGFFAFDDASVVNTAGGGNLLLNGGFEDGAPTASGGGAPNWTYFAQDGVTFQGSEATGTVAGLTAHSGNAFWYDGATEGYDGLDQTFDTVVGNTYQVSFYLTQAFAGTNASYQQISTNGESGTSGNGIDVAVYAGNGLPPTTPNPSLPEPATWATFLGGFGMIGAAMRRRARGVPRFS